MTQLTSLTGKGGLQVTLWPSSYIQCMCVPLSAGMRTGSDYVHVHVVGSLVPRLKVAWE